MSPHLTTADVARVAREHGYAVTAGEDQPILAGCADSRLAQPGDLFGAFPGENVDGNRFTLEALERGAVAAVCERLPESIPPGRTVVQAPSTTAALHAIAGWWRDACDPGVVGITGTVGKTTAKELIAATLATRLATHRSPGNFNSREGLPLALMSLRRDHDVSVLELAMDSRGEIAELAAVARPDVGVVLNVGRTHISKLGSIEAIRDEKLSLARALPPEGTAILNADDPLVAPAARELGCRVITFGACSSASLRASDVAADGLNGLSFTITHGGRSLPTRSPLPGAHVLPAALAAIGVCLALDMSLDEAVAALAAAESPGRMRILTTPAGVTIIDDRYNASPASVNGALEMLATMPARRIALLGAMAELGPFEEEEHRRAGRTAAAGCDTLLATGDACRWLVEEARAAGHPDAHWFATKDEAAHRARAIAAAGDTILVKASRGSAFETIIPILEGPA